MTGTPRKPIVTIAQVRARRVLASLVLVAVPNAAEADISYGYDRLGRLTTALYDNGLCIVYSYDANGNRTAQLNVAPPPQSPAPLWGAPNWNNFDWNSAPQHSVWGQGGVWGCFKWTPP